MRRSRTVAGLAALALACALTNAASAVVLDAFTDPLPPNPCLPVLADPIVFYGAEICDGDACPPYAYSSCYVDNATQTGLAGVLSSKQRILRIIGAGWGGLMTARVRTDLGVVEVRNDGPYDHGVFITYGNPYTDLNPGGSLGLDLAGLTGFRVPVTGTVSPSEPMQVLVYLTGGAGSPRPGASASVPVTASGDVLVPLSAFTPSPGFSFSDVWGITVGVTDCNEESCPDAPWPARSYAIGPITVDAVPTPVAARSWGTLKTRYR